GGNHSHFFEIRTPHRKLEIRADTTLKIECPAPYLAELDEWSVRSAAVQVRASADPVVVADYTLPSPLVELDGRVADYARGILGPDRPLGEALTDLFHRIHS